MWILGLKGLTGLRQLELLLEIGKKIGHKQTGTSPVMIP